MTLSKLLLGAALFAGLFGCSPENNAQTHPLPGIPAAMPTALPPQGQPTIVQLPDFASLVEKYGVAVVNISTTQHVKKGRGNPFRNMPGLPDDEALQEFFRRFLPPDELPEGHPAPQSLGSGFILTDDGVILTNAHVVDDAEQINVRLTDKREFKAKVLGIDKRTDIAVLKIDAKKLPSAPVGNPEGLRVGEWVVAIGSPFGFDNTVTAGIVSAKGRSLPDESYVPFIQTDVALNPGNSGGPLFNLRGEVVGINSQIYSRSGGYMGISFAIPIDVAMRVAEQLRTSGKVSRGRLGIAIQELNKDLAESFGLEKPIGALVSGVEKSSPAEKAGIQAGDIVLAFDGKAVNASRDLPALVGQTKPGTRSKLEVWRDRKKLALDITVGELDGDNAPAPRASAEKSGRFGLTLAPIPPEQAKTLGIDNGVLVQKSEAEAARAGVRSGDIILSVNNVAAKSPDQVAEALKKLKKGQTAALLVRRDERSLFVALQARE
jgi:serine protease Do